ncbi:MAG TPA: PRC-barrel domain-containing protein [Kineosporiaceae bacterium]|nr:PRC-barrel domain-containing protein [Kineosporiaceae bacterium]
MALPDPEQVTSWGGKLLVDRAGRAIGTVTNVYNDDDTGLPEWATTRIGEATVFIPLEDAVESDGQIKVVVHRDDVAKAPLVLDRNHISRDEEVRLYRHYGIPYSAERSPSGLPGGDGPQPSRAQVAVETARAAVAEAVRRLRDPGELLMAASLATIVASLATIVWTLRRRRPSNAGT